MSLDPWNTFQRDQAKKRLEERFELLSHYVNQKTKIKVRNPRCGHVFESKGANLINRGVECPICNREQKSQKMRGFNQERTDIHHEWLKGKGKHFESYYRRVRAVTRKLYRKNKEIINPRNLPLGRSGTPGTYQVDHIRSVKECFLQDVPVEECAALENLQVITWEENLDRRDMSLQGK
jgi:hypothetical protein